MAKRESTDPAQPRKGDRERTMNEIDDETTVGGRKDIRGIGDEDEEDFDEEEETEAEDLEEDEEEGIR